MNDIGEEEEDTMWIDVVVLVFTRPRGLLDVWAMSMGRVVNLVLNCRGAPASRYNNKRTHVSCVLSLVFLL